MTTTKPKTMCSEKVHYRTGGGWGRMYPCKRAATVERDGKHYCTQHDPERIAREYEEQKARWAREREEDAKKREREAKRAAFFREVEVLVASHSAHEARVTCTCALCILWTRRMGPEKPEVRP